MVLFDYSREPRSDIAFVDMKVLRLLRMHCPRPWPFKTSLCVMSRVENSSGLILACHPLLKRISVARMSAEAIIFLLMSTPVSSTMLLPASRDYLLQQIMCALSKTLPKRPYWSHSRMNYYIQKTWKSKDFPGFCSSRWYFPLLNWWGVPRFDKFYQLLHSRSDAGPQDQTGPAVPAFNRLSGRRPGRCLYRSEQRQSFSPS